MLQISFIRNNREKIISGLKKRFFKKKNLIDEILILDRKKKKNQKKLNNLLQKSNIFSEKIKKFIKKNKKISEYLHKNSLQRKNKIKIINTKINKINNFLYKKIIKIPNIPNKHVKKEAKNNNNILYEKKNFIKNIKYFIPHWEFSKKINFFNSKLGTKISGSGFCVYINLGAKLQRALIQYFLDQNISAGYIEYCLPYLINKNSAYYTGQIPDKNKQMYYIKEDNLYLIPTGEIPLLNIYQNQILQISELPIKATTYTSCFRREAGSYGKKVRGLNRLHQFDKVEIINITKPEESYIAFYEMIFHIKNILINLELPFRIKKLSAKDIGFTSSMTYDFEVYAMGQKKWLEVSSVSNCTNFQSNRLKLRYRKYNGKIELCHTLNGSSLAIPRILVALLENFKKKNFFKIPKVLIPYLKKKKIYF